MTTMMRMQRIRMAPPAPAATGTIIEDREGGDVLVAMVASTVWEEGEQLITPPTPPLPSPPPLPPPSLALPPYLPPPPSSLAPPPRAPSHTCWSISCLSHSCCIHCLYRDRVWGVRAGEHCRECISAMHKAILFAATSNCNQVTCIAWLMLR